MPDSAKTKKITAPKKVAKKKTVTKTIVQEKKSSKKDVAVVTKKAVVKKRAKKIDVLAHMVEGDSMHPRVPTRKPRASRVVVESQDDFGRPVINVSERVRSVRTRKSVYKKDEGMYEGGRESNETLSVIQRNTHTLRQRMRLENERIAKRVRSFSLQSKPAQRRHVTFALACLTLLIIVGNYVSPKTVAESAAFYPSSCLGGWVNPKNVEGAPQVEGNIEEEKFNENNSAVLSAGISADIYCGGFAGEFNKDTKPTKINVALSWSKGKDIASTTIIIGDSFASSTMDIIDGNASTTVLFTFATSSTSDTSSDVATSTLDTLPATVLDSTPTATTTTDVGTTTDIYGPIDTPVIPESSSSSSTQSEGIQVSPQATETTPSESNPLTDKPISLLNMFLKTFTSQFARSAYADEVPGASSTEVVVSTPVPSVVDDFLKKADELLSRPVELPTIANTTSTKILLNSFDDVATFNDQATSSFDLLLNSPVESGTTSAVFSSSSVLLPEISTSTTLIVSSSSDIISSSHSEDESMSNFLEVLYTFDGVTWSSLGKVNEESAVYRTFEIPVTATTSWSDMSQLQIKVQSIGRIDPTPTMYLDGIKVEVLYDTPVLHDHPDFARDTILKDKSDNNVRVISIINSDTNNHEIWYTTIESQAEFGVAPGSWVKVDLGQDTKSYRLLEVYGRYIFWVDDTAKMLWTMDLQKSSNDGMVLNLTGTTSISFIKSNDEHWSFDYNNKTKEGLFHIKE